MPSGWSAGQAIQLARAACRPFHLVVLTLQESDKTYQTTYMTDLYREIDYGGNTYTAAGYLLGFTDIEMTSDLLINNITLQISGVDQVYISALLTYRYLWQPVIIYKWFVGDDDATIGNPVEIFRGYMDGPTILHDPDAGSCVIAIPCSSHWADFERRNGRHTNNASQQLHFPDDRGLEYASVIADAEIVWSNHLYVFEK